MTERNYLQCSAIYTEPARNTLSAEPPAQARGSQCCFPPQGRSRDMASCLWDVCHVAAWQFVICDRGPQWHRQNHQSQLGGTGSEHLARGKDVLLLSVGHFPKWLTGFELT